MIVLFTDFGLDGPYTGQIKTVLYRTAPGVPVVDLFADAPAVKPKPAAYLLAAGMSVRTTVYSNSSHGAPVEPGPGRSASGQSRCRRAFMGAICSRRPP